MKKRTKKLFLLAGTLVFTCAAGLGGDVARAHTDGDAVVITLRTGQRIAVPADTADGEDAPGPPIVSPDHDTVAWITNWTPRVYDRRGRLAGTGPGSAALRIWHHGHIVPTSGGGPYIDEFHFGNEGSHIVVHSFRPHSDDVGWYDLIDPATGKSIAQWLPPAGPRPSWVDH